MPGAKKHSSAQSSAALSAGGWRKLIDRLALDYPDVTFANGAKDTWSPHQKLVIINERERLPYRAWSLLHELSHALLGHDGFKSDFELLRLEMTAWENAQSLAARYGLSISDEHIQRCLDSYRDWLHRRATCPDCRFRVAQHSPTLYVCFNCGKRWQVSESRLSRPYRRRLE